MDRRALPYATLASLLAAALVAVVIEVFVEEDAAFTGLRGFLWLGAAVLSALGLAVFSITDYIRQRRRESVLLTSLEVFEQGIEAAPTGIGIFNPDRTLEAFNHIFAELMFRDGKEPVRGTRYPEVLTAPTGERRLGDGRWIRIRQERLPSGGFATFVADISEIKLRSAELRASEDRFVQFLSAAGEWLWETDILNRVAIVLPVRPEVDSSDLDWMIGHHLADLASGSDGFGDMALDACLGSMEARQELSDVVLRLHDGFRWRHVRLSGVPRFDGTGAFLGYRGIGAFISSASAEEIIPSPQKEPRSWQAEPTEAEIVNTDGKSRRLLVAEDGPTNRMLAASILARMGYEVDTVENGQAALEAVQEREYGAVLMDIWMPEMNGIAATAAIRALPEPRGSIPIIAMTAHVDRSDRLRCLEAGMNEHLEKPINRPKLAAVLRKLVGEGTAPQQPVATDPVEPPPAAENEALDLVDDTVIEQLCADAGPEIVAELIGTYMAETDARLDRISEALEERRLQDVAADVHPMKSSSGTFGARRLHALAAQIERASMGENAALVEELMRDLPDIVETTWQAFAERGYGKSPEDERA